MTEGRRILVADDDPSVQRALKRLAEHNGFELVPVLAGADVYEAAVLQTPDLIVLDIHFPDADGRDVLSRLKGDARTSSIPVVVWSGRDPQSDRRIALIWAPKTTSRSAILRPCCRRSSASCCACATPVSPHRSAATGTRTRFSSPSATAASLMTGRRGSGRVVRKGKRP